MTDKKIRIDDEERGVNLLLQGGAHPRLSAKVVRDNVELNISVTLDSTPGDIEALIGAVQNPDAPEEDRQRAARLPQRAEIAFRRVARLAGAAAQWLVTGRENTNHTYDLTPLNQLYLAHTLALVTGKSLAEIQSYIAEPAADTALLNHIAAVRASHAPPLRATAEPVARFGRRLGWYTLARALKPKTVIETGVDKGLGGVLLCAALLRNAAEGRPGHYFGTDLRNDAGYLVSGVYASVGKILYGDSLASLAGLDQPVDIFINDSDHDPAYEAREYQAIAHLLHKRSVILSDNAHSTDALARFAEENGRKFIFFREQPQNHWYPGAGIGIAFP